jgi:hypothetical protein
MAFSNRQHDDGTWRLCLRAGETFLHVFKDPAAPRWPVKFARQSDAKACADELNEKCWDAYERSRPERKRNRAEEPVWEAIDIIAKHGGLTIAQVTEIEEWTNSQ